jgi:hypothetical protein
MAWSGVKTVVLAACVTFVMMLLFTKRIDQSGSSRAQNLQGRPAATIQRPRITPQELPKSESGMASTHVSRETKKPVNNPFQASTQQQQHHQRIERRTPYAASSLQSTSPTVSVNSYSANNMPYRLDHTWRSYQNLPRPKYPSQRSTGPLNPNFHPILCSAEVEASLQQPRLSKTQQKWCKWALEPGGGNVVVGKSWGTLKGKEERENFDLYNCNSFSKGYNPTCDDAWGDASIKKWINGVKSGIGCKPGSTSNVTCYDNDNNDRQCVFDNVQLNFGLYRDVPRPSLLTPTKVFDPGFFSVDCKAKMEDNYFPFPHMYKSKRHNDKCDYVINGTVLLYSHDDITNLGHTMNDILNVWVMLWMHKAARHTKSITFLNVDSFKLGHNHHDALTCPFYEGYNRTFQIMLKGRDFGASNVCMQHVLLQPAPPKFFIWDSWFRDNDCTLRGPSTLFQRYNLHLRHNFGLLANDDSYPTNERIRVVLIERKQYKNLWASSQTSRNTLVRQQDDGTEDKLHS